MAKQVHRYVFEVEGTGEFPKDMLRYDNCKPHRDQDEKVVEATYESEGADDANILWDRDAGQKGHMRRNRVQLETEVKGRGLPRVTDARWRSFTWRVVTQAMPERDFHEFVRLRDEERPDGLFGIWKRPAK